MDLLRIKKILYSSNCTIGIMLILLLLIYIYIYKMQLFLNKIIVTEIIACDWINDQNLH